MSGLPSLQLSPGKVERAADARALAQALRALRAQPGVAALSGPPDAARALLEVLAGRLGPPLRVLVVRGGALDPDAFCERALEALHAEASSEPRAVFEAYLAHLRSRGAQLALLVEAADALPAATLEWLASSARGPTGALRVVAAGEDPEPLLRLVDRCGAQAALIRLGEHGNEGEAREHGVRPELRLAAAPPAAATAAPARSGRRWPGAWPVAAATFATALLAGLLCSRAADDTQPVPTRKPGVASVAPLEPDVAPLATPATVGAEVGSEAAPRPEASPRSAPAPVEAPPVDAALDALESGDSGAFKSAIRRIDGPAAVQAEAELLQRLEESQRQDRERRMLAAWGLAFVGSREALASLDAAAEDADPHVAALAERSAALIRMRLARQESDAEPR